MLLKKLAPATAQKECQIAAQFFRHAYRKGLIDKNPFEGVSVGKATNDERRVFVTREVIQRVLDQCPDWQWRLVVALARYGGLRCPSEIALLEWSDIHWDTERFTVSSPKTKRYGKASRIVPIFPELRPFLDEAFTRADEGEKWVVPMLGGDANKNLGTRLTKIIRRAGVEGWPKPFQNCRSSRQTELEQKFPTYVVCSWLGNTPTIAHKHYLTVTEDHFTDAANDGANDAGKNAAKADPGVGAKTGDKLGMQTPVSSRGESQTKNGTTILVPENASFSDVVALLENALIAEEGLEPPTRGL
ncbi:MAG: site-specific integrase [Planctomycetales bacterium]|nr:site-specific integrase [Planctomycetales bacterium]